MATLTQVDDHRFGSSIRTVRLRRGWRQVDLAVRSGVSRSAISRLERGHLDTLSIRAIRAVASCLDIRADLVARWRAGDLDRLLNARHSALYEAVARWFRSDHPEWVLAPEATFAIYSDRGIVDILAWHPGRQAVLIIELKTEISDVNELLGTLDRKRRVARQVAAERKWPAGFVGAWLIVAAGRTNRRRIEAHAEMIRNALPAGTSGIRAWLRDPVGNIGAVSSWAVPARSRGSRVAVGRTQAV